jgi:hypothetical protein
MTTVYTAEGRAVRVLATLPDARIVVEIAREDGDGELYFSDETPHFERIMYHIRGSDIRPDAEIAEHKVRALQAIGQCAMLMRRRIDVVDREPPQSADPDDEECADCLMHPTGVCNEHVIHEPPF